MASLNYNELGLKCGIEIHQQLEGKKLFCECRTEIRKGSPDFKVIRRLRASAGEEGRIDQAALYEQKKQKYFVYRGYNDITCDVELDEEPPHPVNQEALKAVLQVAKMLNCEIVDEIQVMRKTVIDGSNTSGFQRTMLVGVNGFVKVNGRRIGVESVCLEEEACQIVERTSDYDVYNLSRLGIPLVEIATGPDIKTPEEAKEAASKIGMILRSTGKCKRGIGSIRQDVNLSIKGGARAEIKGFQEYKSIPKIMDYEIERQLKLIKQGKKPKEEVRKAEPDMKTSYLRPMPGMDRMYPETDLPPIKPDVSGIKAVKTIEEKSNDIIKKYNISDDLAKKIVRKDIDFVKFVEPYKNVKPQFIAETLILRPKEIEKETKKEFDIFEHENEVQDLFYKINEGELTVGSAAPILTDIAEGKKYKPEQYKGVSDEDLEKEIAALVKKNPSAPVKALMGMLMAKHRGKIDGRKAMELLKKHKKE